MIKLIATGTWQAVDFDGAVTSVIQNQGVYAVEVRDDTSSDFGTVLGGQNDKARTQSMTVIDTTIDRQVRVKTDEIRKVAPTCEIIIGN